MTRKEMISTLKNAWSQINMLANTQKDEKAVYAGYDVANRVRAVAEELEREGARMARLEEAMLIRCIFG